MIVLFLIQCTYATKCGYSLDDEGRPIETEMEPYVLGEMTACPFFSNSPVCCLRQQDDSMSSDFKSLDATFGSDGGGCDICAANMKRFWCHFSCDPNQGKFLKIDGYQNITDPRDPTKMIEAQMVTIKVHPSVACDVFSSCQRTSFASQVSAMQTPGGFFTFQGEQSVSSSQQYIKIEFSEVDSLVMGNIWNCNQTYSHTTEEADGTHYWDDFGFEIKEPCGCNTCDQSCDEKQQLYDPPGVFYGMNQYLIILAWGWCLIFAIGITIYRECMKRNARAQEEEVQLYL